MVFAEVLLLSVIICFVESISGGIISRICGLISGEENYPTSQVDFFILMFHAHISSPLFVAILSRIPVNLMDRLITVPLSYAVYSAIKRIVK